MQSFAIPVLIFLGAAGHGFAATFLTDGYAVRVWQTEDGLPQNLVTSAVQTRDGYLWFGTEVGLARFDGERFQNFDPINTPELQDRRVTSLFENEQGTLWIGHESGAITRYRNHRFDAFRPPPPDENVKIIGLGGDEQGRVWALRGNGTVESCDDHATRLPSLIAPDLPSAMDWTRGTVGSIWVVENGTAARLAHGRLTPILFPPALSSNYAQAVGAAAGGGVWVLCDNRIRRWVNDRWMDDRGEAPHSGAHLLLELHDGVLAVGTLHEGLYLVFPDGHRVHFDRRNGLPQDWVRFLYEDREKNLWVGTGSAGLVSIHATAFAVLNSPDQWRGCSVLCVAPGKEGALWIGTDGAGLYHLVAGKWTHYGEAEGLGNLYIWAVTETAKGDVWAGPYWWGGPFRLENGQFVRPANVEETSSVAFALLPSPGSGELLIGNRDGLLQLDDKTSRWLLRRPNNGAGGVRAVVRDRAGVIWCGFSEGGLARIAGDDVSFFHRPDGLASDAVQCLFADDDGTLWIGTVDNGLSRFKDGRFANISVDQGLADSAICHLLDDGLGYIWISTHHGIQRVAKNELNRCADGTIPALSSQIYDRNDGLPTVDFTGGLQAAACRTTDGRLWFASSKGVLSVDPARIESNPTPPPVVIESILVDGKSVAFPNEVLRLSPRHQRLEFRFSGLSFVAPEKVHFKYRLDGIDKGWVEAGSRRFAFYSQLPAGRYRFHVIACNNDGVWNSAGASLAFTVAPFFWQTWWFVGSCALAALSAAALLARYVTRRRLQRRMQQLERQHAIERERARIARDIHDDLGTSLTRIAMLSQPARDELDQPQHAAAMLSRIYSTAREVTRSLDEIVWAIDPRHDTLDSLVNYMGKFAQDLLSAANIRCRLELPVDLPAWPLTAEMRHHLFLAFKEALNNALKHAGATEVHVSLHLRPDAFVLAVRDDGCGFDQTRPNSSGSGRIASGHGLRNLQTRIARIGGHCEITTESGRGTIVSFVIGIPDRKNPGPWLRVPSH
jgi:signal transduction histidine kinase/ligand-binding sensor domain-containing protein